jgi:hypothetical protein
MNSKKQTRVLLFLVPDYVTAEGGRVAKERIQKGEIKDTKGEVRKEKERRKEEVTIRNTLKNCY